MSFVTAHQEALAASAGPLRGVGSAMNAGNAAAATPTTRVVPVAADEVSARVAKLFEVHAAMFQVISAQGPAILRQLVDVLTLTNGSYAATEAANAGGGRGV